VGDGSMAPWTSVAAYCPTGPTRPDPGKSAILPADAFLVAGLSADSGPAARGTRSAPLHDVDGPVAHRYLLEAIWCRITSPIPRLTEFKLPTQSEPPRFNYAHESGSSYRTEA